jgi:hypothetical protein
MELKRTDRFAGIFVVLCPLIFHSIFDRIGNISHYMGGQSKPMLIRVNIQPKRH